MCICGSVVSLGKVTIQMYRFYSSCDMIFFNFENHFLIFYFRKSYHDLLLWKSCHVFLRSKIILWLFISKIMSWFFYFRKSCHDFFYFRKSCICALNKVEVDQTWHTLINIKHTLALSHFVNARLIYTWNVMLEISKIRKIWI